MDENNTDMDENSTESVGDEIQSTPIDLSLIHIWTLPTTLSV